ncbi:MAG: hypothetical protein QXE22_06420 [Candidatus Bathyarchaeia archaeon]
MRRPLMVVIVAAAVLLVDYAVESMTLPIFYSRLPHPMPYTSKPIGAMLIPVTFLHLTLAVPSLLAVLYAAEKAGYNVGGLLPKSREAKIQYGFLITLFLSGMALWWQPLALFPFIVSGMYLLMAEIR